MDYCVRVGVYGIIIFDMGVTLREGDREYFYAALDKHFPGMRQKYHQTYGYAYEVPSKRNVELMRLLRKRCREAGIVCEAEKVFEYLKEYPEEKGYEQLSLF